MNSLMNSLLVSAALVGALGTMGCNKQSGQKKYIVTQAVQVTMGATSSAVCIVQGDTESYLLRVPQEVEVGDTVIVDLSGGLTTVRLGGVIKPAELLGKVQ